MSYELPIDSIGSFFSTSTRRKPTAADSYLIRLA